MTGFLAEVCALARQRAAALGPPAEIAAVRPSFLGALKGRARLSLIAEFKRRSPSRPDLAPDADLGAQVRRYQAEGAAALSVLTEPRWFGGSLDDLRAAAGAVALPILRKDFLVDPRQVGEAVAAGASAVLLIARVLPGEALAEMVAACRAYGIDALVECHDEAELDRALCSHGVGIGINNRDLDSLRVDRGVVLRLLPRVPDHVVVVAESGYDAVEQLAPLRWRCDAVLVGTALMTGASFAIGDIGDIGASGELPEIGETGAAGGTREMSP